MSLPLPPPPPPSNSTPSSNATFVCAQGLLTGSRCESFTPSFFVLQVVVLVFEFLLVLRLLVITGVGSAFVS